MQKYATFSSFTVFLVQIISAELLVFGLLVVGLVQKVTFVAEAASIFQKKTTDLLLIHLVHETWLILK
jgi:hypothetical protein